MNRPRPTLAVMTRAARVADETGRVIEIVSPDGMVFRINPKGTPLPPVSQKDAVEEWFAGGGNDAR